MPARIESQSDDWVRSGQHYLYLQTAKLPFGQKLATSEHITHHEAVAAHLWHLELLSGIAFAATQGL